MSLFKVRFNSGLSIPGIIDLKPGSYWLTQHHMASWCGVAERGSWWILEQVDTFIENENRPLLVIRAGGLGDLLLLSSIGLHVRNVTPHRRLTVGCMAKYKEILCNEVEFLEYPFRDDFVPDAWNLFDAELLFETERGPWWESACRLMNVKGYSPGIRWVWRKGERRIQTPGITMHLGASWHGRSPTQQWWVELLTLFRTAMIPVTLVGSWHQYGEQRYIEGASNSTTDKRGIREVAQMIWGSDLFIGPDSILRHIAEAVGTKYIGLFGPIKAEWRSTGENGFNFNGAWPCAGCNFHPHGFKNWPDNEDCNETNICEAINRIPPSKVFSKAMELLGIPSDAPSPTKLTRV